MSLDSFQKEVLTAFFDHEEQFFLTGGAALVGFHLDHRTTKDLDLFTTQDRLTEGASALHVVARRLGASIETVQTAATFRRYLLRRAEESVVVDLVQDLAPQIYRDKLVIGTIKVDRPEEILANKLCALLSRAELRDLVDLYTLAERGYSIEGTLPLAARKDGGLSPGQLAWVLSEITLGDDMAPPGGVSVEQLRHFMRGLQDRLEELAFPKS